MKVGVLWDRTTREAALTGTFLPDENRRLVARLGGFLRKKVAVQWREVPPSSPDYAMALFKRAQASVLMGEPDQSARIDAARRHADATTKPLIERERLFVGK